MEDLVFIQKQKDGLYPFSDSLSRMIIQFIIQIRSKNPGQILEVGGFTLDPKQNTREFIPRPEQVW